MCAPSRFSVLTGRYPSRSIYGQGKTLDELASSKMTDVAVPKFKMDDDFDENANLATYLRAEGYTTGTVGKWHTSYEGTKKFGVWEYDNYETQTQKAKDTGMDYVDGFYIANMDNYNDLEFSHNQEWITANGLAFIEQAAADEQPFFLYFNPTLPHAPDVSKALLNFSIRATPAGLLSADAVSNMPNRSSVISRAGGYADMDDRSIAAVQVDDTVGALYAKLDELGILDDTIIVFIMDHGVLGKSTLYETGARIAMFARYPNGGDAWKAGTRYHNVVSNIDLAPTMLHLATGVVPNSSLPIDGRSFMDMSLYTSEAEARLLDKRAVFVELAKDRTVITQELKYFGIGKFRLQGLQLECSPEKRRA